jgi:hypothetical protein
MTIKIVFIGIPSSDINTTYLTSTINLPTDKTQSDLSGGSASGVTFKFNYSVSFADPSVASNLGTYLTSIQKVQSTRAGPPGTTNPPQNPYFNESNRNIATINNYFYDANQVEQWFNSSNSFGRAPIPGYTLYIADLSSYIPSLTYTQFQNYQTKCTVCSNGSLNAHYYNTTVTEPDLGLKETRHFMTGWGGDNRFYFLDLSAGPSYVTTELPLQVAVQNVGVASSPYARVWRTQYVADYISGVVYDLFSPDQVYPVSYSAKYVFHLFFLDSRSLAEQANGPRLPNTVNMPMVRSELARLVPFANVTVVPKFANLTSYPTFAKVVSDATTPIFDSFTNTSIVDIRPIYQWLSVEGHVSQFINASRDTTQIDIPEFIFAFTGNQDFGITFKEYVLDRNSNSIWGISLGDLVLISHSQQDLTAGSYYRGTGSIQPGKGIGYTGTIIHESGHEQGLAHPFQYDITDGFVNSVMAYYPDSFSYSQFDRDMVLRGINDELLIYAQVTLAGTTYTLFNAGSISAARQAMTTADQKYSSMDYSGAVKFSLSAAQNAANAQSTGGFFAIFNSAASYLFLGVLIGAGVGLGTGFLVFRKKRQSGLQYYHCPTCGRPLRWDAAMTRWYCDYCQKPI